MNPQLTKYQRRAAYHWRELSRDLLHGWPYSRSRVEWVMRQCVGSRRILEIGCGDGAGRLAKAGKVVTGVDPDDTALSLARAIFAHHRMPGEFYPDLGSVKRTRFDAVILAEVVEHLEDAERMLGEIVDLLSDNGLLVLTTPIRVLERSLDAHHVHEFWPGELQALLSKYFDDVRLTRMHPVWFVDLMCFGIKGIRPVAMLANLLRLCIGVELIDNVRSSPGIFWAQAAVAAGPRRGAV